jgi:hypothetical protein
MAPNMDGHIYHSSRTNIDQRLAVVGLGMSRILHKRWHLCKDEIESVTFPPTPNYLCEHFSRKINIAALSGTTPCWTTTVTSILALQRTLVRGNERGTCYRQRPKQTILEV